MDNQQTTHRLERAKKLSRQDVQERVSLSSVENSLIEFGVAIGMKAEASVLEEVIASARTAGVSRDMLSDTVLHLGAYVGLSGVTPAAHVLDSYWPDESDADANEDLDHAARYERGIAKYGELNASALDNIRAAFGDIAGHLIDATFSSFYDTFGASKLPVTTKQMITVGTLAGAGNAAPQLQFHVGAALNVGVTQAQIIDILLLVQAHAGMPAAYNGLIATKAAIEAGTTASPGYR